MPSTSRTQQRLMGVAYAVKKGDMQISDVDVDYRDKVKDLVDGMTLKQLKDFAETKHEGLPEVAENISTDNVGGMGPVKLPTSTEYGSGDVPAGQGDAEEEYKKKRRKMKHVKTFESFLNESHFKVGDKVTCIKSGMTGTVIGLDKAHGAEDEEYYEVEREDGKVMKYSPSELKLHEAKVNESKKDKIYMALGDMEDWMPDDPEVQDEYYAITNVKDMTDFFEEYADTDVLQSYGLTYRDLKDLAKAALNSNESKRHTKVNEEYIELPSLDEPAKDLIEAFKEWYDATATDWDSFKDDMAEDSVDEAAKNAQMEILAHLSNEMNNIIKDRKFKVRADFK